MNMKQTFSTAYAAWKSGGGAWGDVWRKFSRQPAPELPEGPGLLETPELPETPAAKGESPVNVADCKTRLLISGRNATSGKRNSTIRR